MSAGGRHYYPAVVAGIAVVVTIAVMLWAEFFVTGDAGWDVFLGLFLVGLIVTAILMVRYFINHAGEIGEARFDTVERKH